MAQPALAGLEVTNASKNFKNHLVVWRILCIFLHMATSQIEEEEKERKKKKNEREREDLDLTLSFF